MAARKKSLSLRSVNGAISNIQRSLKSASRGAKPAWKKQLNLHLKKLEDMKSKLRRMCDPKGVANFTPSYNVCSGFNPPPPPKKK